MIVPPVSGLTGSLPEGIPGTNPAAPHNQSSAGVGEIGGLNSVEGSGGVEGSAGTGPGSFGSALSNAVSSLEGTQTSADAASESLALGTAKDPESAVVTVEDAQMAMDLASTIRTKATEAVQGVLQTQV
jgi:flagellar hook-basal body complex protein FliE